VLRDALEAAAERRLRAAFEAGALAGRNAAEAFFARCESPRAEGQVMLLVGVAPAVPAEFLVFRLVRAGVGLPLEAAA
jgi:phage tail sheath protein FI